MPEDRAGGGRNSGHGLLRRFPLLTLAICAALLAACVDSAWSATGGASLGGSPAVHHATSHDGRASARGATPISHATGGGNPLSGRAMWIWELSRAGHGDLATIVRTARLYGIGTLLVKSGDGTDMWSQFSSSLVHALHADGLKVCAWQYVYGNHPAGEANVGAAAVRDGADCLIIDAESEYEGKYISAQTYIQRLRAQVGANYPLALAGFPYVDYHPGFPYSVFLGPGGAQYNAPQMYWKDIGTTTDAVFAHTYAYNLIYGRPIFPLGQVYNRPPARQIFRFRELSRAYGAAGVSWWDWQEATSAAWMALSRPAGALTGYQPYTLMAPIKKGAKGDLVVWAQEHLISAGYRLGVDGGFGGNTRRAVLGFQRSQGLTADGIVGPATWSALLRYRPVYIKWSVRGTVRPAAISDAGGAGIRTAPVPSSASRPAKRDEIPQHLGAGRP
ncbi:MAG TPA: peptidoglycan-binding domain-containing protein [Solirubrobacteraceae bacterium]|nr:peptidoglycan-binding domain-containing protein [Solirubrobacteraceae bacterium]